MKAPKWTGPTAVDIRDTLTGDVVVVDLRAEAEAMIRLDAFDGAFLERRRYRLPNVKTSVGPRHRGHACYADWSIYVPTGDRSAARVRVLLLHELTHLADDALHGRGNGSTRRHHGPKFKRLLARAANELWGIGIPPEVDSRAAYDLDDAIVKRLSVSAAAV